MDPLPRIIYGYDAYCGWCYGFSPVMTKIDQHYRSIAVEVLSGGMILPEKPRHIGVMANYILQAYKTVEDYTGIKFGRDYLWHINNPDQSDWFPHSEKPAIALCVFKDYYPKLSVQFAAELQYALHYEGRDLCDDEAYRHLLEKHKIPAEEFYKRLHSEEYQQKAHYEFALCKQLKVTGFPAVFLQVADTRLYAVANGYTDYDTLKGRIDAILGEAKGIA